MRTINTRRRFEQEPNSTIVGVLDQTHFLDANPAQCQLLHWKEAADHYKELHGFIPLQNEEKEDVEDVK